VADYQMVEVAGVEPASERLTSWATTPLFRCSI